LIQQAASHCGLCKAGPTAGLMMRSSTARRSMRVLLVTSAPFAQSTSKTKYWSDGLLLESLQQLKPGNAVLIHGNNLAVENGRAQFLPGRRF